VDEMGRITPFLWFDDQAEEAVEWYSSIFPSSKVVRIARRSEDQSVLTIEFELDGERFMALNGGPAEFSFNESVSFVVHCSDQEEVDHYWDRLTEGGEEVACGWLKDRYGLRWQIVPDRLPELLTDPDPARATRAFEAMLQMKKLDLAVLEAAASGG
jgi:predicted 3-demethylubiquinone-9 3-methyltransferase (glyoxalase superfamily)